VVLQLQSAELLMQHDTPSRMLEGYQCLH